MAHLAELWDDDWSKNAVQKDFPRLCDANVGTIYIHTASMISKL